MVLFRLALVSAACLQAVFWGWLYLERLLLGMLKSRGSTARWCAAAVAGLGAVIVVLVARGLIHWGRLDGIGTPATRRLIVGAFVTALIIFDLFRARSKEWTAEGEVPYFWRAKWVAYCLLMPVYIASVLQVPVTADVASLQIANAFERLIDIPVLGICIGAAAMLQTFVIVAVCATGLYFLRGAASQRARQ